jgi:hypothetical protein
MLSLRAVLLALIVLATAGFVTGTTLERHDTGHESAARVEAERAANATPTAESSADPDGGETETTASATRGSGGAHR